MERPQETFTLTLYPVVMRGVVIDPAGRPLTEALISSGSATTRSRPDGTFDLPRAVPGEIIASRPSRAITTTQWSGEDTALEIVMPPKLVRAIHVTPAAAADEAQWEELLALADATVVNGLVVDLKDDAGRVYHESSVELARASGSVMEWFALPDLLADAEQHDLYAISRIVVFVDPLVARSLASSTVWDQRHDGPYTNNGLWYLDPTDSQARTYAIDLAVEACRAGFDEIQFDHVVFPGSTDPGLVFDGVVSEAERGAALRSFVAEAAAAMAREGCALGVNVLGSAMTVSAPGAVGQDFPGLSEVADVLSPTVYPSHYSTGWFGLEDPSSQPGTVVGRALDDGLGRLTGPAVVRPWLQDFSYGVDAVRAQIAAAEDLNLGWMLWNGQSIYSVGALDAEKPPGDG